ncbi:MAG: radical SAM protein [Phycisphaerales bacterium]|nr:radical SAM protein [Phycisphaerales bacterium]
MPDLAARMPRIPPNRVWVWRVLYALRAMWRHIRVTRPVTALLGPQYRRSRDLLEIDITYLCNLHCDNCNRSVSQARDTMHMPLESVVAFVDEWVRRGKRWRRIRVLGGEPTLHPEFQSIVRELLRYREWHPACIVEVVSNGYGPRVIRELEALPPDVMVDNTAKTGPMQPHFGPFNLAPVDDPRYLLTDYRNACSIARDCGMGLTPMGYYPCAVAGGIDRIAGAGLGALSLPDDGDDMTTAVESLCRLCGRFRDGHFVPRVLRPRLEEERVSRSWRALYERWHAAKAEGRQPVAMTVNGRPVDSAKPGGAA